MMNNLPRLPAKFVGYKAARNGLSGIFSVIAIFSFILCGGNSAAPAQAPNTFLRHHGFNVSFAEINDSPRKNEILESVKRQIEIVEQVGLSPENLNFFKAVPVVMLLDASGTPGIYDGKKKTVFLKGKDLAPDKPILLHELLHAFHHRQMAQGFQNESIEQFHLKAGQAYPGLWSAYFLSNNKEFFAVTASIYLFGNIARPPFNRQTIKANQPVYYKFLEGLFGERKA